jgi:putative membrane protein
MFLSKSDTEAIDALVARAEARTGVQIVTAVIGRADSYAELPWTAFALGASVSTLAVIASDLLHPEWAVARTTLLHGVTILGSAAACALLAVFVTPFARLFLRETRSEVEVRQYAESLFLRRELFSTKQRTGLLVLISLFERRIQILPDVGFRGRVAEEDWQGVAARMSPMLRATRPRDALGEGLDALERLLVERGFSATGATSNELPDRPIEEEGA